MKWAHPEFLAHHGLGDNFNLLVGNTSMTVFSALNCDTYKRATLEFLSTFHDDLALLGRNTTLSFRLNNVVHVLTFEEFCNCFGFSTEGELDITEEAVQEARHAWQQISVPTRYDKKSPIIFVPWFYELLQSHKLYAVLKQNYCYICIS
jgi:hypothetical protein